MQYLSPASGQAIMRTDQAGLNKKWLAARTLVLPAECYVGPTGHRLKKENVVKQSSEAS